jgi:hypothetical protein
MCTRPGPADPLALMRKATTCARLETET